MRSGELIVVVVNALGIVLATIFSTRWRRALRFGAIVPPVVCLAQIGVEGARWQMVPAYVLSLVVAAMMLSPAGRHRIRLMAGALLTVLLTVAIALPVVLPVFRFPDPDGPYGIGTVTYHWTDTSRDEVFLETPAPRELMVQVWYPATKPVSSSARSYYVDDAAAFSAAETSVLAASGGVHLPRFFFDHFGDVTTNASPEAPAAAGDRFPVLLYATGLDGFRQANTAQVEYLVSRGYVVVGVDQPYTSAASRFPDGRIVSGLSKPVLQPLIDQSIEPVSPPPTLHGVAQPDGIIPYLADDFRFTLDRLVDVDSSAPILAGRLDLSRVGMFGVSLGAMVTAQACHTDPRISACLMMDAAMPAPVALRVKVS